MLILRHADLAVVHRERAVRQWRGAPIGGPDRGDRNGRLQAEPLDYLTDWLVDARGRDDCDGRLLGGSIG